MSTAMLIHLFEFIFSPQQVLHFFRHNNGEKRIDEDKGHRMCLGPVLSSKEHQLI